MKLIGLSCPNCNAELQVNPELKKCVCNYCGHQFLIDDGSVNVNVNIQNPRELGRELEYGRRSALGGNDELTEKVHELIEPISKLNDLEEELSETKSDIPKYIFASVIFGIITALSIVAAYGSGIPALLFVAICVGVTLYCIMQVKKKMAYETTLRYALSTHKEIMTRYDISIIPPDYRNKDAMNFIYNALRNQRALTMQEAVNQYETSKRTSIIQ